VTGRAGRRLLALLTISTIVAACSEELTQPGQCPELCPGGIPQGLEEVLTVLPNQDSTFTGYTTRSNGTVMLVGSGVPTTADTSFGIIAFNRRPDSVSLRDTLRPYTIDSVRLSLLVVSHDTAARHVQVQLYRLPSNVDTTALSYASLSPLFTPANLIGGQLLPDTAVADSVRLILKGSQLAPVTLQPGDAGRLVVGVSMTGDTPTGGRIGNQRGAFPPEFLTYVRPIAPNSVVQGVPITPAFTDYVSRQTPTIDPELLTVGGVPSSRVLLRFPWPARLRDSATIVRATLELVPAQPITGVRNETASLDVRGLATDFGAKSPVEPSSLGSLTLPFSSSDTVRVEIANVVRFWQGGLRPPATFLSIAPEVETFSRAVFGSSRSGAPPRIRINYLPRFPFTRP
jgi:hypothetical protein